MTETVVTRSADPAFITKVEVKSNKEGIVNVANGVEQFTYYESVLQDSIRATVIFNDSGDTINGKTAVDGLPIVGQEEVTLEFEDNNENTIEIIMYVNKVTPLLDESTKSMVQLDLVSKELILNEKIRVNERFDGKISDHIKKILSTGEPYFKTDKFNEENIETTQNNYNFIGNNRKPFYLLNWLSSKAVPEFNSGTKKTAGFLTYETSEGFYFKSVDALMDNEKNPPVKSLIYTNSPGEELPVGYDIRILEYEKDNRVDVQQKLSLGAYDTRIVTFNPFNCYYEVLTDSADNTAAAQENANSAAAQPIKHAGKELPTMNEAFNRPGDKKNFSRTTYFYLDVGSLPDGTGQGKDQQQLEKSRDENFKYIDIVNQSIMRYNQLYSSKMTITIPGDLSLHIGNSLFVDVPKSTKEDDDEVNKEDGGLYIIVDLCHYFSGKGTYTKLNLVRDSVGREGNHLSRS